MRRYSEGRDSVDRCGVGVRKKNPDYCVDKLPHPVSVNVWGCFCAHGMGYCYIFNEKLDKKKLRKIVAKHLKQSAALYYRTDPPEQYYVLQDNDPKHTSRL